MSTWWERATDEQKLEQIDAGIALGMTGKQISMNLRAYVNSDGGSKVTSFARRHGRSFPYGESKNRGNGGRSSGKFVGLMNARRKGVPETMIKTAYEIFRHAESVPFDMDFLDEEMSA